MGRRALIRGGTAAVLLLLAVFLLLGDDLGGGDDDQTTTPTVVASVPDPGDGQATIDPGEAQGGDERVSAEEAAGIAATLAAIDSDDLPYDQDGATFQNREGMLPQQPQGHYREYTVETPGSDDRGARRLVIGESGETYYTRDHYDSFIEIDPEDFR
jgi:ribonuclease T1